MKNNADNTAELVDVELSSDSVVNFFAWQLLSIFEIKASFFYFKIHFPTLFSGVLHIKITPCFFMNRKSAAMNFVKGTP